MQSVLLTPGSPEPGVKSPVHVQVVRASILPITGTHRYPSSYRHHFFIDIYSTWWCHQFFCDTFWRWPGTCTNRYGPDLTRGGPFHDEWCRILFPETRVPVRMGPERHTYRHIEFI